MSMIITNMLFCTECGTIVPSIQEDNWWVCPTCKKQLLGCLPDSGERREFETGAVRDMSVGKGRFDLMSPWADMRLALVFERGAIKYNDRNWESGIPIHSFIDSAKRHIAKYLMGMDDEDHLAQALWNLHCAVHMEEVMPEMQTIPRRKNKTAWIVNKERL